MKDVRWTIDIKLFMQVRWIRLQMFVEKSTYQLKICRRKTFQIESTLFPDEDVNKICNNQSLT